MDSREEPTSATAAILVSLLNYENAEAMHSHASDIDILQVLLTSFVNKMYPYAVLLTSLKDQHHSDCSVLAGEEDPNASPNISSMIVEV